MQGRSGGSQKQDPPYVGRVLFYRPFGIGLTGLTSLVIAGSVVAWAVPLHGESEDVWSLPVTSSQYVVSGFSRTVPVVSGLGLTVPATPVAPGFSPAAAQTQQTPSIAPRKQINTAYAEYPQDALEKRIGGTVVVDVVVNPAGDATTGAAVSGPQELRAAAFKAALGLKFEKGSGTKIKNAPPIYPAIAAQRRKR